MDPFMATGRKGGSQMGKLKALAAVSAIALATGAQAQVYRCAEDATTFTDKPCPGGEWVQVKPPNIVQPGPTFVPDKPPEKTNPPIVLQTRPTIVSTPPAPLSNVFQQRDGRNAADAQRTGGTYRAN
jgi:hypothetical protein